AFSTVTDTANITVTPVNDAPVLASANSALVNVDSSNSPASQVVTTVATLVGNAGITDIDPSPLSGIAITAVSGAGTWEYSTNGTTYLAMGAVTGTSARLLASTAFVRYTPAASETDNATLTYQAWDQTSGSNGGLASAAVNGGITAFSTASSVATHTVAPVNDAPVMNAAATPVLTSVAEDSGAPSGAVGTLVSALVNLNPPVGGLDNVTDAAVNPATGIALTTVDAASGTWFYSINGGTSWVAVGAVANNSALLLRDTDRLYFQPNANVNLTVAPAITFRAWDQTGATAGQQGTKVDTTTSGGQSAFSTVTDTANITVTPVNDAPVLASANSALANVDSSNSPASQVVTTVATLVGNAGITDIDPSPLSGIAITAVSGAGTWEYSTNGTTYLAMGAVTGTSARLLASTAFVRYTPAASETDNATLTYQAWDQTSGSNGGLASAAVNGGITAFSTASSVATHTVAPVNDAPVMNAAATPVLTSVAEDSGAPSGAVGTLVSALVNLNPPVGGLDNVTDAAVNPATGIALTTVDAASGTWFYSINGGTSWVAVGAVANNSALLLRDTDRLYFQPNANVNLTVAPAITFRAWDQTGATAGQQGTKVDTTTSGGQSAFSTVTDTANITVTPVNDAPVLASANSALANVDSSNSPASQVVTTVATLVGNAGI